MRTALKLVLFTLVMGQVWPYHLYCGELEVEHSCGNFCDLDEKKLYGFGDGDCIRDCICKDGYIRNAEGYCEPVEHNQKWLARCQLNEHFVKCADGCEEHCDGRVCEKSEHYEAGCLCRPGTFRNSEGHCVEVCEPEMRNNGTQDLAAESNEKVKEIIKCEKFKRPEVKMMTEAYETTKKMTRDEEIGIETEYTRKPSKTTTNKVIALTQVADQQSTTQYKSPQSLTKNISVTTKVTPFTTTKKERNLEENLTQGLNNTTQDLVDKTWLPELPDSTKNPQKISTDTPELTKLLKVSQSTTEKTPITTARTNKINLELNKPQDWNKGFKGLTKENNEKVPKSIEGGKVTLPGMKLTYETTKKTSQNIPATEATPQFKMPQSTAKKVSLTTKAAWLTTTTKEATLKEDKPNKVKGTIEFENGTVDPKNTEDKVVRIEKVTKQEKTTQLKVPQRTTTRPTKTKTKDINLEMDDPQEWNDVIQDLAEVSNEKIAKAIEVAKTWSPELLKCTENPSKTTNDKQESTKQLKSSQKTTKKVSIATTRTKEINKLQDLAKLSKVKVTETVERAKVRLPEIETTTKAYEMTKKTSQIIPLTTPKTTTEKVIRIEQITEQDKTTLQCNTAKMALTTSKIELKLATNATKQAIVQEPRIRSTKEPTTKTTNLIPTTYITKAPPVKLKPLNKELKTSLFDIIDKLSKLTEAARKLKVTWKTSHLKEPTEDPKLKICSEHRGADMKLFRHPNSCTHFYQCHLGKPMLRKCPDGLHYDDRDRTCHWPEVVRCNLVDNKRLGNHDIITETKDSIRKLKSRTCRSTKHSFLWDDSSCRRYWKCETNGEACERECEHGQHFDMTTETCKQPGESDCRRRLLTKSRRGADHLSNALLSHFVSHS